MLVSKTYARLEIADEDFISVKFDTEQWYLPLYFNRILTVVQNLTPQLLSSIEDFWWWFSMADLILSNGIYLSHLPCIITEFWQQFKIEIRQLFPAMKVADDDSPWQMLYWAMVSTWVTCLVFFQDSDSSSKFNSATPIQYWKLPWLFSMAKFILSNSIYLNPLACILQKIDRRANCGSENFI